MIYLDTSVVVSLYCPDDNSTRAAGLLQGIKDLLLITTLGELETVNAFGLRAFRKEMSPRQTAISLRNLEADLRAGVFQMRALPELAFARARTLSLQATPQLGVRTADLLHVAAALELGATAFYSFDLRQRAIAKRAGLKLNPAW